MQSAVWVPLPVPQALLGYFGLQRQLPEALGAAPAERCCAAMLELHCCLPLQALIY